MMQIEALTGRDSEAVEAFTNFLSWGEIPHTANEAGTRRRYVPPAWWAYAFGDTTWCPPKGEL